MVVLVGHRCISGHEEESLKTKGLCKKVASY